VHLVRFYYKNFGLNSGALFPIPLSSFRGGKADFCTAFPASRSTPIEVLCRKFSVFPISFVHRIVPARLLSSDQSTIYSLWWSLCSSLRPPVVSYIGPV